MSHPHLKDSTILVVEDEPLIVMDISMAFENAGAHLTTTNTVKHAKLLVEHDGLSAAILDHALSDGDSTSLCKRLTERGMPFLMYSGFTQPTAHVRTRPTSGNAGKGRADGRRRGLSWQVSTIRA